jgi:hypothetical protein
MDPNALEQEIDQATQALHSTVNSVLNTMQSSVFGGLDSLAREMSALEKSSKEYLGNHYSSQFPWSFRTDGPKKRYRITIEELPPLEETSSEVLSSTEPGSSTATTSTIMRGKNEDGDDFTISQGRTGTPDEGKTVITASVAPGLLDWLLFTTHDDSFFRQLGTPKSNNEAGIVSSAAAADNHKIRELSETEQQEAAQRRIVPTLVNKVKQVGTSWEKDARHWWQRRRSDDHEAGAHGTHEELDRQHHLFTGTSQSERDQEEERHSTRWPRGRSWGRSEVRGKKIYILYLAHFFWL